MTQNSFFVISKSLIINEIFQETDERSFLAVVGVGALDFLVAQIAVKYAFDFFQ